MMRFDRLLQSVITFGTILESAALPSFEPEVFGSCPIPVLIQPVEVVVQSSILISTFCASKTSIVIKDGITLTITDTPTFVSTLVTVEVTTSTTLTRYVQHVLVGRQC